MGILPFSIISVKAINSYNLIKVLKDKEGNRVTDMQHIKEVAFGFYQNFLGKTSHEFNQVKADRVSSLFKRKFSPSCVAGMQARVTKSEIQKVIFSMNKNKAPWLDGFSVGFFQKAWSVVGEEVRDAILEFFTSSRLLKEANATILTLVPKKKNPASMEVISSNEGAFIPRRSIAKNILLAQELVCNYHREQAWIRECITSPSFSLALNGSLVGYFQGRKGLQQGDLISPYLFVLAMEGLSLLLEEIASNNPLFAFHPKCSSIKLTHLCFADDLLIFFAASINSVKAIKGVLDEFELLSGLKEGTQPVRYLGVPLITKRMATADCDILVSKIAAQIESCSGTYSCAAAWEKLRVKRPVVEWWKILVFCDAIVTKEIMCRWGYARSTNCLFCHGFQESRDHIFFQCSFSRRIWKAIMAECSFPNPPIDWESVAEWSVVVLHGKGLKFNLGKLCFGAFVYQLWKQRNAFLHGRIPKSEEAIIMQIKWEVKSRTLAKAMLQGM
ncbi:uncharacterized protein LOC133879186 [Alnus glutinosa]|uniref:uncharacterized protein LOC133879186 n=1 Tax=Alnus glutinosa TaxID=3517 RepID=UPI002D794017|nr:uncharacterized protein LOC133879186 [Alnus glutinosa]